MDLFCRLDNMVMVAVNFCLSLTLARPAEWWTNSVGLKTAPDAVLRISGADSRVVAALECKVGWGRWSNVRLASPQKC